MNPIEKLPAVLVVLGVDDFGPCDSGQGTASCPHCGAEGRYIINFLCDDGTRRGAMRGCFTLFPGSDTRTAKLVQEAFARERDASKDGKKLASWWADILVEVAEFTASGSANDSAEFASRVAAIDERRQVWLRKNGYNRRYKMAA